MRSKRAGEHGQVILVSALLMGLVFLGLALSVDFGSWQSDRRVSQSQADAAVLSGAWPLAFERDNANMGTDAVNRVTEWAQRNGVQSPSLVVNPRLVQQCFASGPAYDGLPDGVETEINADSKPFFSHIFHVDNIEVGAHARACVGSLIETSGIRPWAMPQLGCSSSEGSCTVAPGGTCSAGSQLLGGKCVNDCFGTDAAGNIVPLFGSTCKIRSDEPQSIGSIGLSTTSGAPCGSFTSSASDYKTNIIDGSPANCSIGDTVQTAQGMKTGPTLQGLKALLATEGACDARYNANATPPTSPPPGATDVPGIDDFWQVFTPADAIPGPDTVYTARECDDDPTDLPGEPDSPRFVTVAVVTELPTKNGTQPVQILAFAGFFIEKCQQLDNNGNVVPNSALAEAKCSFTGSVSSFQIVGRFIQFQQLGGTGGPLNPFGTKVILLTQ